MIGQVTGASDASNDELSGELWAIVDWELYNSLNFAGTLRAVLRSSSDDPDARPLVFPRALDHY